MNINFATNNKVLVCQESWFLQLASWMKENLLLVMTILGVVLGVAAGAFARTLEYSSQTVMLVSFPGEIMMRMLKMLILPLIISSIITGQRDRA